LLCPFAIISEEVWLGTGWGARPKEIICKGVRTGYNPHNTTSLGGRLFHLIKGEVMNKADLIEKVAKDAGVSKAQADAVINSLLDGVTSTLKKGGSVTLVGFGSFSVGSRKARTGRNPQTGAAIKIPAKKVPKFSAGADLKKAVNKK
jgi:DNA-binding protein HU-beta